MLKVILAIIGVVGIVAVMLIMAHHRGPRTNPSSRNVRMMSAMAALAAFAIVIAWKTHSVFFGMITVIPLGYALAVAAGVYLTGQAGARAMEMYAETTATQKDASRGDDLGSEGTPD